MISVCMTSYNGEKYIGEQIKSILCQLGKDDEIIVSDDGSTDATLDIINGFHDDRIRIVKGPGLAKPAYNFENALRQAKGDYIFLSDQDDVWLPNKVKVMMEAVKDVDLVVSDCVIVDQNLHMLKPSYFATLPPKLGLWNNIIRNHFLGCCLCFRSGLLNYALPFPKNVIMHDIWLGLCAEAFGKTAIVNEPLMMYRRHGDNQSPASEKSNLPVSFRIEYRWRTIRQIYSRMRKFK